jgi:predicted aspartyl protease
LRKITARSIASFVSMATSLSLLASTASADTLIPLRAHNQLATFYISVGVGDHDEDYLVDTGAGYMTITSETLKRSQEAGTATYLRELDGRMADGSVLRVPVYRLSEITIGAACQLRDVEVAVLPGASRGLLGLSALRRTSPFEFSVDPPTLRLSNCTTMQTAAIE